MTTGTQFPWLGESNKKASRPKMPTKKAAKLPSSLTSNGLMDSLNSATKVKVPMPKKRVV